MKYHCDCNDCGNAWETEVDFHTDLDKIYCPRCGCGDIIKEKYEDYSYWNYIDFCIHSQINRQYEEEYRAKLKNKE